MSYFPAFIRVESQSILVVGGGNIAYEKLEKLLDFTHNIVVIAVDFSDKMLELIQKEHLRFHQRTYCAGDIRDFSIVVVAVDDIGLQRDIFEESKEYKCLCNSVDSVEYCDFIFPSYIKEGDLTVAISTSGASPAFAKHFKRYLQRILPSGISEFLSEMKSLRLTLPKGEERMELLEKKVKKFIQNWSHTGE